MTFSTETRLELARVIPARRCCAAAELAGMLGAEAHPALAGEGGGKAEAPGGSGEGGGGGTGERLEIHAGHPAIARKVYTLVKALAPEAHVAVARAAGRARRRGYVVRLGGTASAAIEAARAAIGGGQGAAVPRKRCCRRSFLRGAFLCRGSLSAPSREYHFEVVVESEAFAAALVAVMASLGQGARQSRRKGAYVVYLKEGEGIVDVLSLMGAHRALLELENVRIVKGMRNRVNRLVNCETANVDKTVNAALGQIEAIRLIDEAAGLRSLPPALRELARARLENPYASLRELGEMLSPRASKASVGSRMRRLLALAAALKKEPGEGAPSRADL